MSSQNSIAITNHIAILHFKYNSFGSFRYFTRHSYFSSLSSYIPQAPALPLPDNSLSTTSHANHPHSIAYCTYTITTSQCMPSNILHFINCLPPLAHNMISISTSSFGSTYHTPPLSHFHISYPLHPLNPITISLPQPYEHSLTFNFQPCTTASTHRGNNFHYVSDHAQVEVSKKVHDVLRFLCIKDTQSEPYQQHQNSAERRYKSAKFNLQQTMNMSGAPAECWLLCMHYTCFIMNRMALKSLHWRTPFECLHAHTIQMHSKAT